MRMLELFHGGENPVREPKEVSPFATRPYDFGTGFYATTSRDQAARWVSIRIRQHVYETGCVSIYVFNTGALTNASLRVKVFDGPTEEWFDFVMRNRHEAGYVHDYDIVMGPVANDNVYETLTLFEDGILSKGEAIARLRTYQLVDQVLFHSSKAFGFLNFVDSEVCA